MVSVVISKAVMRWIWSLCLGVCLGWGLVQPAIAAPAATDYSQAEIQAIATLREKSFYHQWRGRLRGGGNILDTALRLSAR